MVSILIVENEKETLQALEETVRDQFPEARIDTATNYQDAIRAARSMSAEGWRYEVAMLDVRLPTTHGGQETLDANSRRELLNQLSHKCVVLNHSVLAKTEGVQRFLYQFTDPTSPTVVLVDASPGRRWHLEALRLARQAIYGRRVQEGLDRMSSGEGLRMAGRPTTARSSCGPDDYDLNDLMRDLRYHWADLNATIQEKAREFFDVAPDGSENMSVNLR